MRKRMRHRLMALVLAMLLMLLQTATAFAAPETGTEDPGEAEQTLSVEETAEPEFSLDAGSEEYTGEIVPEAEMPAAAPDEAGAAETVEAAMEETASLAAASIQAAVGKTESAEELTKIATAASADGSLPYGLAGMPSSWRIDAEETEAKAKMLENRVPASFAGETAGVDYAEDEIYFAADSEEYARQVAEAYCGTLISFRHHVAVVKIDTSRITVPEAVACGSNPNYRNLPVVNANRINSLSEPGQASDRQLFTPGEVLNTEAGIMAVGSASSYDIIPSGENTPAERGDWSKWSGIYDDPALQPEYWYNDPGDENSYKQGYQWMHDMVDTFGAWSVTRGSSNITVAVIDTGVYEGHGDLHNVTTDKTVWPAAVDTSGHGTHVAGIIAAAAGNGNGGTGIAPGVNILSIPIFRGKGFYNSELAAALFCAADHREVDIINMSLGIPVYDSTVEEAIDYVYSRGKTICASMGNEGTNNFSYPAAYDHVIAVASVNRDNARSDFSNYGDWADVAAPGTDIFSTWNGHTKDNYAADSTLYTSMSGTSMAAPVVAGICALYMSAMGGRVDPDTMEKLLKTTATKVSATGIGKGIVNAGALLAKLDKGTAPKVTAVNGSGAEITDLTSLSYNSVLRFAPDRSADGDAGGAVGYVYTVNGTAPSYANGLVKKGYYHASAYVNDYEEIKVSDLVDLQGLKLQKRVNLKVARIYGTGKMSKVKTVPIEVSWGGKSSPDKVVIDGPKTVAKGKTVTLKAAVYPSYLEQKVTWSLSSNAPDKVKLLNSGKLTVPAAALGKTFTVIAESDTGSVKATLDVTVTDPVKTVTLTSLSANAHPEIYNPGRANPSLPSFRLYSVNIADRFGIRENQLKLDSYLSTASGAESSSKPVFVSSRPQVAEVDPESGLVTAHRAGDAVITCKATDGSGAKRTVKVKVIVPASSLRLIPKNGQIAVGYGKSLKVSGAIGSTYGKASVTKLKWVNSYGEAKPEKVMGYTQYQGRWVSGDVTGNCNVQNYITVNNGTVSVKSGMKKMGSTYYVVTMRAETTDGTGLSSECDFMVLPAVQSLTLNQKTVFRYSGNIEQEVRIGTDNTVVFEEYTLKDNKFYTGNALGKIYIGVKGDVSVTPHVTSSNPKVATAEYIDYSTLNGYAFRYSAHKAGTVKFTFTMPDGSGKKLVVPIIFKAPTIN